MVFLLVGLGLDGIPISVVVFGGTVVQVRVLFDVVVGVNGLLFLLREERAQHVTFQKAPEEEAVD